MRKLMVFNSVSLDGYFVDAHGDMSWAHQNDAEWRAFTQENAGGGGELLFGRVTYDLMVSYWPTREAHKAQSAVAEQMNNLPKVVFSRTMVHAAWNNTRLVKGDPAAEVRRLKTEPGQDMMIMGSGTIVSQLTQARLIDAYQIVLIPIVLGKGRTMFDGLKEQLPLRLTNSRTFSNGNVVLSYEPIA